MVYEILYKCYVINITWPLTFAPLSAPDVFMYSFHKLKEP